MFRNKKIAVQFLQEYQRLSGEIADSLAILSGHAESSEFERARSTTGQLLAKIMVDVYYPIVAMHPELRLPELLGKMRQNATYVLMRGSTDGEDCEIVASRIAPDDAQQELEALRRVGTKAKTIYWMELEDAPKEGQSSGVRPLDATSDDEANPR